MKKTIITILFALVAMAGQAKTFKTIKAPEWITGTVPLITSHSPCTTAEDGRCQSLAITVFSHHIFLQR